jgi:hypothetical protein
MHRQSDRYAVFIACTREPLPRRDLIWEEVPWVDLTSVGQLDPPPSATGMRRDEKLGFEDKK